MWGVLILGVLFRGALTQISDENLGWNFVNEFNDKVGSLWNENVKKAWNYYTNITDYNLEVMVGSIKSSALNGTASIYFLKVLHTSWKILNFFASGGTNNNETTSHCCKPFRQLVFIEYFTPYTLILA